MPVLAHPECLQCGNQELQLLLSLSEEGIPHGLPGHNFACSYTVVAVCRHCGHGQIETYSHDCYVHWEEEDQEMYWVNGDVLADF